MRVIASFGVGSVFVFSLIDSFLVVSLQPSFTLFPYTTLFRSQLRRTLTHTNARSLSRIDVNLTCQLLETCVCCRFARVSRCFLLARAYISTLCSTQAPEPCISRSSTVDVAGDAGNCLIWCWFCVCLLADRFFLSCFVATVIYTLSLHDALPISTATDTHAHQRALSVKNRCKFDLPIVGNLCLLSFCTRFSLFSLSKSLHLNAMLHTSARALYFTLKHR